MVDKNLPGGGNNQRIYSIWIFSKLLYDRQCKGSSFTTACFGTAYTITSYTMAKRLFASTTKIRMCGLHIFCYTKTLLCSYVVLKSVLSLMLCIHSLLRRVYHSYLYTLKHPLNGRVHTFTTSYHTKLHKLPCAVQITCPSHHVPFEVRHFHHPSHNTPWKKPSCYICQAVTCNAKVYQISSHSDL